MRKVVPLLFTIVLPAFAWPGCAGETHHTSGGAGAPGGSAAGGKAGSGGSAGKSGATGLTFDIHSDTSVHSISPLIYGLNTTQELATTRPAVVRLGGNRWTAYNWENNASNAGSDYQYSSDGYLVQGASDPNAPGGAVRMVAQPALAGGAAAIVTVPNVDYVAADKNGAVSTSDPNRFQTRFKQNQAKKGSAFSLTPDGNDASVYQDEFVNWVKTTFTSGQVLFDLDNEPDSWMTTHPEVHPAAVTYAELVERNARFAGAIKDVWPSAKVLGFVSYGWNGYTTLQNAPDAKDHPGDFINYYLSSMKTQADSTGRRLIDYLDLHWYPEAKGGGTRIIGTDTTNAVVAARLQAPRSLWDPTYIEDSWIGQSVGPIQLIPRIKGRIDLYYPGTGYAITEWSYGGGAHISGAIAAADVLGIFGREGVALACNWDVGSTETFTRAAFRVYRNFDGAGGQFGDTSIAASTTDDAASSVYASLDSTAPDRMIIVAINKQTSALSATIKITHTAAYSRSDVFVLTSSGPAVNAAAPLTATASNTFLYSMPALSVSVLVPKP